MMRMSDLIYEMKIGFWKTMSECATMKEMVVMGRVKLGRCDLALALIITNRRTSNPSFAATGN